MPSVSRIRFQTCRSLAVLGAAALLLIAVPAQALVISEVLYDADGADSGSVFVELFGEPGTELSGLVVEGINGSDGSLTISLPLAGTLPSDGLFVLADDAGDGTTFVPNADLVLNFDFQNGPDSILLRDGAGTLDALGYGVFGASEVFAGEGSPAPDPPAGSSLARRFADVDTDDNLADFIVPGMPTPGVAPLLAIPEPSPAALVGGGLGMLGLAGRGRRPRTRAGSSSPGARVSTRSAATGPRTPTGSAARAAGARERAATAALRSGLRFEHRDLMSAA